MTFKEKLAHEYPEKVSEIFQGGCDKCPYMYGYEARWDCTGITCEKCWNRKILDTPMTAEEAWEIAKQVALTTNMVETARIFIAKNICGIEQKRLFEDVFALTPQEAKAKLEEWESKQIRVGDVITTINGCAEHLVLRVEHNPNRILHVCNIANGTVQTLTCEVKKTGKHIDIQSVLDQIGGGKHD